MTSFNVYRIVRKGMKNSDDVPVWAISLEALGEIRSSCPESALQASRAKWPHVPRGDILVGPGDQGSLVQFQNRGIHPRGISQHITRESQCPSH
jgi:hypothetical protein